MFPNASPESFSQSSSAVLSRFTNLQDPYHPSSPLSLYNSPTAFTTSIISPALPKLFTNPLHSPHHSVTREGRTHARSKTCQGFGELLRVPSSPSDFALSPASAGSNPGTSLSSPLSSWTLKSPSAFVHRRSHTTVSSSLPESWNLIPSPLEAQSQEGLGYANLAAIPETDSVYPMIGEPINLGPAPEIPHQESSLALHKDPGSSKASVNRMTLDGIDAFPPAIDSSPLTSGSKASLRGRKSGKVGKGSKSGVRRTNSTDLESSQDGLVTNNNSECSDVSITPGGYARRYACVWEGCGKAFTTSGHLARHHRIHTGEKRYECLMAGCKSRFSRQDNMLQHYRTHLSGKCRRLPSVSSVASSTEGGKPSTRLARHKKTEDSTQDIEPTSLQHLESFPEVIHQAHGLPQEPQFEPMLDMPAPLNSNDYPLIYEDGPLMEQQMPYIFPPYSSFDLPAGGLTLDGPDGYHTHDMNTYLVYERSFPAPNWPIDFQNQAPMLPSPESDVEVDYSVNSFGNSFTDLQYSLPALPQEMQVVCEGSGYGPNPGYELPFDQNSQQVLHSDENYTQLQQES